MTDPYFLSAIELLFNYYDGVDKIITPQGKEGNMLDETNIVYAVYARV